MFFPELLCCRSKKIDVGGWFGRLKPRRGPFGVGLHHRLTPHFMWGYLYLILSGSGVRRLNDIPVPSIYGPSADERTF